VLSAFAASSQFSYKETITLHKGTNEISYFGNEATGFVIQSAGTFSSRDFSIIEDDTIEIPFSHFDEGTEKYVSGIFVFSEAKTAFQIESKKADFEAEIILLNVPKFEGTLPLELKTDCGDPSTVPQDIWREGLPDPDYDRIESNVQNIIIHHSASSRQTLADYTDEVRSIYIYHTDVNKWSDIGYNYLIAPDGTIFNGRDPGSLPQDAVQGAHFSARNANTLGICLIGNFESQKPTLYALDALAELLSWKCNKDNLDPLGIHSHPLNANLAVIAGHRDGGSTLCPGAKLYARLPEIRSNTYDKMTMDCNHHYEYTGIEQMNDYSMYEWGNRIIAENKTKENIALEVYSLLGQKLYSEIVCNSTVEIPLENYGSCIVKLGSEVIKRVK